MPERSPPGSSSESGSTEHETTVEELYMTRRELLVVLGGGALALAYFKGRAIVSAMTNMIRAGYLRVTEGYSLPTAKAYAAMYELAQREGGFVEIKNDLNKSENPPIEVSIPARCFPEALAIAARYPDVTIQIRESEPMREGINQQMRITAAPHSHIKLLLDFAQKEQRTQRRSIVLECDLSGIEDEKLNQSANDLLHACITYSQKINPPIQIVQIVVSRKDHRGETFAAALRDCLPRGFELVEADIPRQH